jgi:hypothetical protein
MRIIGLLNWYDEPTDWLSECVTSAARVVDHLIALDGAYRLFPHDDPISPPDQADAIREAATAAEVGCSVVVPSEAWADEIAKRAYLFELGLGLATPEDWFMVLDADVVITEAHGVHTSLRVTPFDAASSLLIEPRTTMRLRNFFRALPGLTVKDHHAHYVVGDRVLFNGHYGPQEQAAEVYVYVDHTREPHRPEARREFVRRGGELSHLSAPESH